MPGKYGATDLAWSKFRGLVEDTDPTEIGEDRAASALNTDFIGDTLRKRLGKQRLFSTAFPAPADNPNPISGLYAYYPKDGSDRILLKADKADVKADASDNFANIIGDAAGVTPMDFVGYQDRVYFGSRTVDLQVWGGAPATPAVYAYPPSTPTAPTPTLATLLLQDMADSTDWTSTDAALTTSDLDVPGKEGVLLSASSGAAVGQWVEADWTAGPLDLSKNDWIEFEAISSYPGLQFQLGIKDNSDTIVWLDLIQFVAEENKLTTYQIDISAIDPADRDASTGMAIAFHAPLSGAGYPQDILFHAVYAVVPFEADTYRYYLTQVIEGAVAEGRASEGAPGSAGELVLVPGHHASAIEVDVPAPTGIDSLDITQVRLYRKRQDAPYAVPRLVAEFDVADLPLTYEDRRTDADLLLADAAEWTTEFLISPPRGNTLSLVRHRLLIGGAIVGAVDPDPGTAYPWRIYLSEYQKPWAFSSSQDPSLPLAAGFIDLPEKDAIVRIIDVDGNAVVFCERSVWTLEGTGWDDFVLRKRASVGLDARWAVAVYGRLLLFLGADGVRCLALSFGAVESVSTWIVSEPISARLRGMDPEGRANAAFGIDERERLHFSYTPAGGTVNSEAVVLDLQIPGALTNKQDPTRPGWTAYSGWGFSLFVTLKRGSGDNGQLLGGDPFDDVVWWCQRDGEDAEIEDDDGAAIAWSWTSHCLDTGRGLAAGLVYMAAEVDPAAGETVTLGVLLERASSPNQQATLSLGSATTGIVALERRIRGRARYVQLRLSGSHAVPFRVRSAGVGVWKPKVR